MPATVTTLISEDEVVRLRSSLAQVSRRLRATAAGEGLTPTQLSVLASVVRSGPQRLGDLAVAEGVNPTMLSRIVAKLEAEDLLRRRSDPEDGRAAFVEATAAGRRRNEGIRAERTRALRRRLDSLAPEHVASLRAALPALDALARALQA